MERMKKVLLTTVAMVGILCLTAGIGISGSDPYRTGAWMTTERDYTVTGPMAIDTGTTGTGAGGAVESGTGTGTVGSMGTATGGSMGAGEGSSAQPAMEADTLGTGTGAGGMTEEVTRQVLDPRTDGSFNNSTGGSMAPVVGIETYGTNTAASGTTGVATGGPLMDADTSGTGTEGMAEEAPLRVLPPRTDVGFNDSAGGSMAPLIETERTEAETVK